MITNQPTCYGCALQPNFWENQTLTVKEKSILDTLAQSNSVSLSEAEREVLRLLAEAWNIFISLDRKVDFDNPEFAQHIHACQSAVALRVARRANPEIWRTS